MSRRIWIAAAVITLGLAGGASALLATPAARAAGWFGPSRGFGHGGHGFGRTHGPDHLRFGIEWALDRVDATDEQVEAIVAIAGSVAEGLSGLHDQHEAQREALVAALAGAAVDREALERLRTEGMALAEDASARLVTAVADAADVLTPEQRRALVEEHEHFHRGGWHR
jgi:protein CpxP